jgi:hypothetical protein
LLSLAHLRPWPGMNFDLRQQLIVGYLPVT